VTVSPAEKWKIFNGPLSQNSVVLQREREHVGSRVNIDAELTAGKQKKKVS
jgi:hypothetical protein